MSAYFVALVRMWRGWAIVLPVIVVNAMVQALLVLPDATPDLTVGFVLLAIVSLFVLIVSFALVGSAVLQAVVGRVDARQVLVQARQRLPMLVLWSLGLLIVVLLGLSLWLLPGFIILAITPYLLLAVLDGRSNPMKANFSSMGRRVGSWLFTVALMGITALVIWVLAVATGFFVTGSPGAFIGWLGLGFVSSWFTCAWALIYQPAVGSDR